MTAREFLLARVGELEEIARAAQGHEVIANTTDEVFAHFARWGVTPVLTWCAAIRAVAELHRPSHGSTRPDDAHECPRWEWQHPDSHLLPCTDTGYTVDCETLILLCRVFADHPEFDASWAAE